MLNRLVCLIIVAFAASASSAADSVWELTPYRIAVLVAAQPGGDLPAAVEQGIAAAIRERAAAVVGGSWKLTAIQAEGDLRAAMLQDLASIEAAQLAEAAKDQDKVILLTALPAKVGGCSLQAREWDRLTGLWNAPVAVEAPQPELLSHAAFRAVLAAFAPLARVESIEGDQATLKLRGGAIPFRDGNLPRVQPGTVFRPVLVADKPQPIDWTYLIPSDPSAPQLRCRVATGLEGNSLPAYHPSRQRLAIGVLPSSRGTKLKLVSRGESPQPLEGYEVLAEEGSAAQPGMTARPLGRSDRAGLVAVAPAQTALRQLLVKHGEQTLLRVPLAPGLAAEVTLPLPDVRGAAALDAALAELEDRLIDLAAQREVLKTRLKAAASDAAAKGKLQDRLAGLPKAETLAARLQQHEQAAKAGEPLSQARLLAKIAELRKLIEQLDGKPAAPPPTP